MDWEVEFTDEFEQWWNRLKETEQIKVDAGIRMLEKYGPDLPYPMSSSVKRSRHSPMRELRVQAHGKPFRVLYAFNPKRVAILLIGGDKTGADRWYEIHVPRADRLYDQHLRELGGKSKREASKNG